MPKFEVEFYTKENGEQPAKEFLLSLNTKMRAKMMSTISILQDYGYELREPYSKHLEEGIFELRAKVGTDISRVLYFFYVCGPEDHSDKRIYQKESENTAG